VKFLARSGGGVLVYSLGKVPTPTQSTDVDEAKDDSDVLKPRTIGGRGGDPETPKHGQNEADMLVCCTSLQATNRIIFFNPQPNLTQSQ
jgi:hypothetical protein